MWMHIPPTTTFTLFNAMLRVPLWYCASSWFIAAGVQVSNAVNIAFAPGDRLIACGMETFPIGVPSSVATWAESWLNESWVERGLVKLKG